MTSKRNMDVKVNVNLNVNWLHDIHTYPAFANSVDPNQLASEEAN